MVDPFVEAMVNIGGAVGRDVGLLAVQAIEGLKGAPDAVLFWLGEDLPDAIRKSLSPELGAVHSAFIAPRGKRPPMLSMEYVSLKAVSRPMANGSTLIVFLLPVKANDDVPQSAEAA